MPQNEKSHIKKLGMKLKIAEILEYVVAHILEYVVECAGAAL